MNADSATEPAPTTSRLQAAIGCAMLAISAAGVVHLRMGLHWGVQDQFFYALVGGLTAWKLLGRTTAPAKATSK